jgi:hypothetical protein
VNHTNTAGQGFRDSANRWCGSFVESNSGGTNLNGSEVISPLQLPGALVLMSFLISYLDPSDHSEINAIRRLGDRFPFNRFNADFWGALSMYTNGESCPMDAAAEVWAGFKEVIYSVSIDDLLKQNWNQIDIDSKRVYQKSDSIVASRNLVIIQDVDWVNQIPFFAWQNMPNNPCPTGCHKAAPGFCADNVPYVPKPLL